MINALIIEDEVSQQEQLTYLLAKNCAQTIHLLGIFDSVEDGRTAIEELQPDVVFLDVHIGPKTGFDLLKALKEINFEVIFTTGYDTYAVEAFKFNAIDYLVKPIESDGLRKAVEKVRDKLVTRQKANANIEALLYNLQSKLHKSGRLKIPTMEGFEMIEIDDIAYCKADNNYTEIHFTDNSTYLSSKNLKQYEEQLRGYDFFRIHQSYLINFKHILSYNRSGWVKMTNGKELEVSPQKREAFKKWINEH